MTRPSVKARPGWKKLPRISFFLVSMLKTGQSRRGQPVHQPIQSKIGDGRQEDQHLRQHDEENRQQQQLRGEAQTPRHEPQQTRSDVRTTHGIVRRRLFPLRRRRAVQPADFLIHRSPHARPRGRRSTISGWVIRGSRLCPAHHPSLRKRPMTLRAMGLPAFAA